eukprot:EG_transcript_33782
MSLWSSARRIIPSLRSQCRRCWSTTISKDPIQVQEQIHVKAHFEGGCFEAHMERLLVHNTPEQDPHFQRQWEVMQDGLRAMENLKAQKARAESPDPEPGPNDWLDAFTPVRNKPRPAPAKRKRGPQRDVEKRLAQAAMDCLGGRAALDRLEEELRHPKP